MSDSYRYSIEADRLPIVRRLELLAHAVALLMQNRLPNEWQVLEWRDRVNLWGDYPVQRQAINDLVKPIQIARLMPADLERFPDRAYIHDAGRVPQIEMRGDDDYGAALVRHYEQIKEGFLLMEWDVLGDAADLLMMASYVESDPEAVWSAPYFLYYPSRTLTPASQVPDFESVGPDGTVPFVPFGFTYLPAWVLAKMAQDRPAIAYPTPDHQFNIWADRYGVRRRMARYCSVKHIHYGHHVSMTYRPGAPERLPQR